MIFSDSPQQRALERMMTAVPRFRPKGGGIMVLHHFEYTAEMCDCRYCPYYRGKRKCTARRKIVQRRTYNTEIKAFSRFDTFDWCYAYAHNGVHSFLAYHVAQSATRQQRPCE